MDRQAENKLLTAYVNSFAAPWTGSIYKWAEENIVLPHSYGQPGAFTVYQSPWLIPVFDALLDPNIEQINFIGGRQIFKSGLVYLSMAYWVQNDPGPMLYMGQNDPMAETFAKTKILPILQNCKPLRDTRIKYTAKTGDILLPHVNIKVSGHKESVLNGLSVRYLLCDELHLWDDDAFEKALHSTNAFIGRRKIVITSTPGIKGDRLSKIIENSRVYRYYWTCEKCKQAQPWYWNLQKDINTEGSGYGITWNKIKDRDGNYNYNKTGDSAWLECKFCGNKIKEQVATGNISADKIRGENEQRRIRLNENSKYVLEKEGDSTNVTFIVPAWVNPKITWKSKVISYLQAKKELRNGNRGSLINFYQHVLGEEWDTSKTLWVKPKIRIDRYDPNSAWPEEVFRSMCVDWQTHYGDRYFIIRAADIKGNSRLIKYGRVFSWDSVQQVAEQYNVPLTNVFVDAGDKQAAVLLECSKRGQYVETVNEDGEELCQFESWVALKGDKDRMYKHDDGIVRYYNKGEEYDVGNDLPPAVMYLWAANPIRNIFGKLRDGKADVTWSSSTLDQDYIDQLYAEEQQEDAAGKTKWENKSRDNHYFDVESMWVVSALMAGLPLGGLNDKNINVTVE